MNIAYGSGYAWSPAYLTVNTGDTVYWSWSPPSGITDVTYRVVQVKDSGSTEPSGFDSGMATATGSYSFQFNQPGVYHYWSGCVKATGQIEFRGIIEVQDLVDNQLTVNMNLNGFTGIYTYLFSL